MKQSKFIISFKFSKMDKQVLDCNEYRNVKYMDKHISLCLKSNLKKISHIS